MHGDHITLSHGDAIVTLLNGVVLQSMDSAKRPFPRTEMSWLPKSRRASLLVAAFLIVAFITLSRTWSDPSESLDSLKEAWKTKTSTGSPPPTPPEVHTALSNWVWNADRDRNNHSLTREQCDSAFPDLYFEIDRSRAYWRERHGEEKFSEDQWSLKWSYDGGLRVLIYDQQLYVTESRGLNHFLHWEERSKATLHNLHRAINAAREPIPNIEFSIKINDNIELKEEHHNNTVWCFSRNRNDPVMEQVWLIPDFNFWAYPRVAGAYGDFQREALTMGKFDEKTPELIWRGTIAFNPDIRVALLEASEGKPWSAVHPVAEDVDDEQAKSYRIPIGEHCKYQFAAHTEGTTWSGRLKYLLSCNSAIFIHPLTFTTHLYHLLVPEGPNQNFVPIDAKWQDLNGKMENFLADPASARLVADNAASIFRDQYFTPAAQSCYFRQLFQVWSEVTHDPDPWTHITSPDGTKQKVWRGVTYEQYA